MTNPGRPRGRVALAGSRLLAALTVLAATGPALGAITFDPHPPVIGQPVTLTLTDDEGLPLAGLEVAATYYPNAAVARTVVLGPSDAAGQVTFAPDHAGLIAIDAGAAGSRTVGVHFAGLPTAGLIVFLIAGTLLFGGVLLAGRKILQGDYVDPTT